MSPPERAFYTGTRPSALRVEWMSHGVRFRIEAPGDHDGPIVDLDAKGVDDLVETLRNRPDYLK